jgi:acetylornithine deacetylase/succinyl-diaminopimelate desuccinylase-like protein
MRSKIWWWSLLTLLPASVHPQTKPEFARDKDEAIQTLQGLIRINTSNPPGNETRAARYLKAILDKEGIPAELFARDSSRANLVARLTGSGKKRPILLMGHTDVVGVEREKWTVDPFGGVIKDGYLYGRGAADDKDNAALSLQVLLMLHRQRVPLDRDVIFLAEAGEEGDSEWGIEFMVAEHFDRIDAELAVLEGGGIDVENGKVRDVAVATTEKVPNTVQLVARGTSGHGSIPRPDNPLVHLAAAVAKLGEYQPPMRLNQTTRAYFQRLAAISPPEDAFLYTHLEDSVLSPMVQQKLRATKLPLNSMLRTSVSPTIIQGGFRRNVIPGDAQATLDIRALPDEDMPAFFAALRRVIDDPAVELVPPASTRPAPQPSRLDTEMFQALERAQAKIFPGAVTIPTMLTAATDGAQLRAKGVQAYGVGNFIENGESRAHGNDERVSLEGTGKFLEFLYAAVVDVAASKPATLGR